MNEPRRWIDDESAPPDVRRLLAAAEPPGAPNPARLAHSRRRVMALASLPAVGGGLVLLQKLALGALLGSVVGLGLEVRRRTLTPPAPVAPVVAPREPGGAVQKAPPSAGTSVQPAPDATAAAPVPRTPRESSAAPLAAPQPSVGADVRRELALLEAARSTLETDPGRALVLLEQDAQESPHGTLVIERELLVIQALARAGRLGEAKAQAARFRAAHPESLYEERITRVLEEKEE